MSTKNIPVEILTEIIRHSIGNPVAASKTRRRIGGVNKTWRRLLYTTRSIWSTIHIECREDGDFGHFPVDTDFDDLDLCLALSHPLPLDIDILMDFDYETSSKTYAEHGRPSAYCQALQTISAHAERWRNFSITGRQWVFEYLPPLYQLEHSTLLRSFSARTINLSSRDVGYYGNEKGALSSLPNLTRFETNFPLLNVGIPWTNLITLMTGFDNIKQCHKILAKIIHLSDLTLIHVGTSNLDAELNVCDTLCLPSVRTLRLTRCGLTWVKSFSFPHLGTLVLFGQKDGGDNVHASHQMGRGEDRCTTLGANIEDISSVLGAASRTSIQRLDLNFGNVPPTVYIPLLPRFQDLTTLSVEFQAKYELGYEDYYQPSPSIDRSISAFFIALMSPSFAPKLESFTFFLRYGCDAEVPEDPDFFICSPLVGKAAKYLCRRSGSRLRRFVVAREELGTDGDEDDIHISDVYMDSSLCLTLLALASEGVDTAWWMGDVDLLSQARRVKRKAMPLLF